MRSKITLLEYEVYIGSHKGLYDSNSRIIHTINPHSYVVAKHDFLFSESLKKSDILLPDGVGIVLAIKYLFGIKIKTLTGPMAMDFLLNRANQLCFRVFFLGSSNDVLDLIKARCKVEYPNIIVESLSPPYAQEFSTVENESIVKKINHFSPDILFVGMTAPKQEKWVELHKEIINSSKIVTVGAAFDWYARSKTPPSEFWMNLKLGWFIRFIREPLRLYKRVFVSSSIYIYDVIKFKLKNRL
jgi:N-acetylglucosaminyldiphosphoundecaprenol N-acetyl-beta-D-mannosaminyltransferase